MLRHKYCAIRTLFLCVFSAALMMVSASAADAAYLIHSHTDVTRSIFSISKAADQGSIGLMFVQEDGQSYGLPVYRAGQGCTVTVQGSAAQMRIFPVDVVGSEGAVRWTNELAPSIGQMRVTVSEGVQTISAADFKNYTNRLTGTYTYEAGAGYRLSNAGYYLVSYTDNGLTPSSVIVQVQGDTASLVPNTPSGAVTTGSSADSGMFAPPETAGSAPSAQAQSVTAEQNSAPVLVNGKKVLFDAYTIREGVHGFTYFKLRDLAAALSGTEKQYEVTWDKAAESVLLISGLPYTLTGGELSAGTAGTKTAVLSSSPIYKDGLPVSLTAYVIGKNNYFKLRDIAELFNFSADWDNDAMCIIIDTTKPYTP